MKLNCLRDRFAEEALHSEAFSARWNTLLDSCSWATIFQRPEFARVWFESYASVYKPLFYYYEDDSGQISHLLCLGYQTLTREIVQCGAHQSDYQAWLSNSTKFEAFLRDVTENLGATSNQSALRFKFLPPELTSVVKNSKTTLATTFKIETRPLMLFDATPVPWDSLRKKSNKSKLSRLKRNGEIELTLCENLSDDRELDELLNQIVTDYDFRQGAVNASLPFAGDSLKFNYHRNLIRKLEACRVIIFTLNGKVIAALFGLASEGKFIVCVFSHSAISAKHSPGKLIMLMGSKLLSESGFNAIDLTPGGAWKDRFANSFEEVMDCTFYISRKKYVQSRLSEQVTRIAKRIFAAAGINHADLLSNIRERNITLGGLGNRISKLLNGNIEVEYRIYAFHFEKELSGEALAEVNRNSVDDLLKYEPAEHWQKKQSFLNDSLAKIERGYTSYTNVRNNRLAHYGWLIPNQEKSFFTEVNKEYTYPEPGSVLFDFYTHPLERGKGLYNQSIKTMLADLAADESVSRVYISVLATNGASRHVIEKNGFTFVESIWGKPA